MSGTIKLTQGCSTTIDDELRECLSIHRWFALKKGALMYVACFVCPSGWKRKRVYTHQMILLKELTATDVIDHRTHHGLDNREANLRSCSQKQNAWNSRPRQDKIGTKYRGVSYVSRKRDSRNWRARLKIRGKDRHLGYFRAEYEAAEAYNRAAVEAFGEYASLNEIKVERR